MANRNSVRRITNRPEARSTGIGLTVLDGVFVPEAATNVAPANDNPGFHRGHACLPVTDAEVRLLHQYIGQQILGLFS